jgi:hypothetical protein
MCPNCKKQSNAHKKLAIASAPSILIIHLKRFFYKSNTSNSKLTTPVWFPTCSLDISNYLIKNDQSGTQREADNSNIYDLFAVCNHQGQNMANGHYTAFCKSMVDTRWYCFDDSNCIQLVDGQSNYTDIFNNGSGQVCTENAYILFYKRRNCMRNEMWWTDYVDRSLFDYTEFINYLNNCSLIEKEQRAYQEKQQNQQFLNFYNLNNLNYSSNTKFSNATSSRPTSYESDLVLMCPRDTSKKVIAERLPRVDLTNDSYSRELMYINHYDELNKPKRLLKNSSKELNETSPTSAIRVIESASNSSTSTSSPSKQSPSINNLTTSKSNSNYSIQNLAEDFDQKNNMQTMVDTFLSYPNDNEYIYSNPNVNQMQYANMVPTLPRSTVLNTPALISNHMLHQHQLQQQSKQNMFYYNQPNANPHINTNYNSPSSTVQYYAKHHPVLYEKAGSQFSSSNVSTESSSRPQSMTSLNANPTNPRIVNSPLTAFTTKTPTPTKPNNRYPTGIETTI